MRRVPASQLRMNSSSCPGSIVHRYITRIIRKTSSKFAALSIVLLGSALLDIHHFEGTVERREHSLHSCGLPRLDLRESIRILTLYDEVWIELRDIFPDIGPLDPQMVRIAVLQN